MANNKFSNGPEHKQHENSGMAFYSGSNNISLPVYKRVNQMATAKLAWVLFDLLGLPVWLMGILSNLDNIKSLILFMLGVVYGGLRVYYYLKQKDQALREKELDLWHKEQDKLDRIERKASPNNNNY